MKGRRQAEISLILLAACAFAAVDAFAQVQRPNKPAVQARVRQSVDWPGWGAAAWTGTREGIRFWQRQARLVGVRINGARAAGGKLAGPGIEIFIRREMLAAGTPSATARKFAAGVSDAWRLWHEGIALQGQSWYPAFAAWPGPQAGPLANVPTPLSSLFSIRESVLRPADLKNRIRDGLGQSIMAQRGASAAVDTFVADFSSRFLVWRAQVIVRYAQGTGPVPSYLPPRVMSGPVVNGAILEVPGSFASPRF